MNSLAACQRPGGAFLQNGSARVLSCVPTPAAAPVGGKATKGKAAPAAASASAAAATYDVVLSDTVLFPEGGGQPTDFGALVLPDGERVKVQFVSRSPGGAIHRVEKPVPVDSEVAIEVDWARRFDHMQQHSSQHLISAVARQTLGWKTLSWWLASAPQECHIEMDSASITPEQVQQLEREVNEWIRRGAEMKLHTWESLAAAREDEFFKSSVSKALPDATLDGFAIRVVEIPGLEFNPCCGTHLSSTAQMQSISLTRVEKGKTSSKVFFLAGERVQTALRAALDIQRAVTANLCCAPDLFAENVRRLQADFKSTQKQLTTVLKELAESDAAKLVATLQSGQRVAQLHRDEVGLNYISSVADLVSDTLKASSAKPAGDASAAAPSALPPYVLLLSSSDALAGASGAYILTGDEALVTKLGSDLSVKLNGKGGGRKGKYQGKGAALDGKSRAAAFTWLQEQIGSA
jgi:misacylated tRNA(Ala) deacylase